MTRDVIVSDIRKVETILRSFEKERSIEKRKAADEWLANALLDWPGLRTRPRSATITTGLNDDDDDDDDHHHHGDS